MQGVTTVVTGNCGSGPADVKAFYDKLEKDGVGTNVAHLVPHNSVRTRAMGNANRAPTADELKTMEDLVDAGIPGVRDEEVQTEPVHRRSRLVDDLPGDEREQRHRGERGGESDAV